MYQHEGSSAKRVRRVLTSTGHGHHGGHLKIGGSVMKHADRLQDKRQIDAAVREGIGEHEEHMHPGKPRTRVRLSAGGMADGGMSDPRADKAPRGKGGKQAKNHIAIVIAPQGGGQQPGLARPMPVPVPARPPMAAPPPAMPPRPMPPPGAPPMGMGAGMPPPGAPPMMMRKAGGRTHRQAGGTNMNNMPAVGALPSNPPAGMTQQQYQNWLNGLSANAQPGAGPQRMPPQQKSGGRSHHAHGGRTADSTAGRTTPQNARQFSEDLPAKMNRPEQDIETAEAQRGRHARGGEVGPGRVEMHAGSGSGEGRLEKSGKLDYCAGGRS